MGGRHQPGKTRSGPVGKRTWVAIPPFPTLISLTLVTLPPFFYQGVNLPGGTRITKRFPPPCPRSFGVRMAHPSPV